MANGFPALKRCASTYNSRGIYGIVRCTRNVGHEDLHRYNRPGHRVHWPTSAETKGA